MTGEIDAVPADDVPSPRAVADALGAAMNAHDIEAFMALFADDYVSERPAHPDRPFRGTDQVRANWSAAFAGVPDFHADPVATAAEAHTIWTEWSRHGTHERQSTEAGRSLHHWPAGRADRSHSPVRRADTA